MENGKPQEKTEYVRNVDIREKFINQQGGGDRSKGEKKFFSIGERDEKWKKLRDIPCPAEFSWIFKHFLQIWRNCEYDMAGNVIFTYRTVNDYVECMKVPLTVQDKKYLFDMKFWALNAISELKEN